jgi:hypothetical protein
MAGVHDDCRAGDHFRIGPGIVMPPAFFFLSTNSIAPWESSGYFRDFAGSSMASKSRLDRDSM